jgi:hypothetical protein
MMASQARQVEVTASVWNEGEQPLELEWDGDSNLFDRLQHQLMEHLETREFGKLVRHYPATDSMPEGELALFYRAFTDPYRGRQVVAGMDEEERDECFGQRKRECGLKAFTPEELYALKPVRTDFASGHTVEVHLPEIDLYELDLDKVEAEKRMETRTLVDHDYDGRRGWTLQTVWFDGKPVMVVNSSGRDGDEYHERWITDAEAFGKLLAWLQSFIPRTEVTGFVKPDAVIPAMTEFYNHTIHDYYDTGKVESEN